MSTAAILARWDLAVHASAKERLDSLSQVGRLQSASNNAKRHPSFDTLALSIRCRGAPYPGCPSCDSSAKLASDRVLDPPNGSPFESPADVIDQPFNFGVPPRVHLQLIARADRSEANSRIVITFRPLEDDRPPVDSRLRPSAGSKEEEQTVTRRRLLLALDFSDRPGPPLVLPNIQSIAIWWPEILAHLVQPRSHARV